MNSRGDITINGGGSVPAGSYESIVVNGSGAVAHGVSCTSLTVNGTATCEGELKAASVAVNGTASFRGLVQAQEFTVNGESTVRSLGVRSLKVRGVLNIDESLVADAAEIRGALRCHGDVQARTIDVDGALEVRDVHAETFAMAVKWTSRVHAIDAGAVTVRTSSGFSQMLSALGSRGLVVDSVRASAVRLEDTAAALVSGGNVVLGKGARIDRLRYSGDLEVTSDASVRDSAKWEPEQTA